MDELSRIKALAETDPQKAMCEMTLGLMRGNRRELRLGYTAVNAALATAGQLNCAVVDVQRAIVDELSADGDGHWVTLADDHVASEINSYPSRTSWEVACGCGARVRAECAAAVEGHFTSLDQRGDEQLRVLAEEDACCGAQELRDKRAAEAARA